MNRLKLKGLGSLLAMALCLSGGPAWAAGKMIDLGTLGGNSSNAYDINQTGQIAGYSKTATGQTHAARYAGGAWQDLSTLGGTSSYGYGINDLGQVVGSSYDAAGHRHAFLWTPEGGMIQLSAIPGTYSVAWDINNSGQIVGAYRDGEGNEQGFLWSGGVMTTLTQGFGGAYAINDNGQVTGEDERNGVAHAFLYDIEGEEMKDLGVLAGLASWGTGLNNLVQVVGWSTYNSASGDFHAARYAASSWTNLGVLSGSTSWAYDINNGGQIVGESAAVSNTKTHAFVYANGVMSDLNLPGWTASHAHGINDRGQIVGDFTDASGTRAFLYNPGAYSPAPLLLLD
jgi:probable HAF family extracellular repeat protein